MVTVGPHRGPECMPMSEVEPEPPVRELMATVGPHRGLECMPMSEVEPEPPLKKPYEVIMVGGTLARVSVLGAWGAGCGRMWVCPLGGYANSCVCSLGVAVVGMRYGRSMGVGDAGRGRGHPGSSVSPVGLGSWMGLIALSLSL